MSEFHVRVVRVERMEKHPNADALSIVHVDDYPAIVKTTDFNIGDLAVYIPVDAIVPDTPTFAFLAGHRRIKARRLRGVFSIVTYAVPAQLGARREPPSPEREP